MAHTKSGGTSKNLRDSNPKYLGVKLYDGEPAKTGFVIVRQRGTVILPGKNVALGKDHTLFAMKNGIIKFGLKRKTSFAGKNMIKKIVSVL